jgi:hypothetical protein
MQSEAKETFIHRCMQESDEPDKEKRLAVCFAQWRGTNDSMIPTQTITLLDRTSYPITQRERTPQGYLKVPGRVSRVGVQVYLASELGELGKFFNNDERIGVYRPKEEVYKPESLASFDNADITNDHPDGLVTAETFKKVVVGHAISAGRPCKDAVEFTEVDLLIKDAAAIADIESGKLELSAGYEAEYVHKPGIYDGEYYDFEQRGIRINHIALVHKARAGDKARLYDHSTENVTMYTVILDTGSPVEVADKSTAQLIQSCIDGLRKRVKDAEEETEKEKAEAEKMKAEKEKKDEELEKEKEKSSDAAIASRVKDIADARVKAVKIAGKDFVCDSVNVIDIKKAALKKVRKTIDWDKQSEAYVCAAWDMESEKTEEELEKQRKEEEARKNSNDSVNDDLSKLYTDNAGRKVGSEAYSNFLSGK